ncbi:MAG: tape measure protein, partial [Tetragenococcus koreensis]|nr:tape measure protein [Tetragenococcus koreensis]
LTNHITKPILGVGAALGGLTLGLGMKRLVGIDDAKAKLEALGNSTEDVDKIMQNADKAIEGTSMRLDETATVAASATAAGVESGEDLTRYLGLTADAASVAGVSMSDMGNVINKATTQGKAQNDVLQQMSEQGLPVYQWLGEEANKAGDEIFQMASDGEISTEMLLDAIEKNIGGAAQIMGEKSFTSALQNMSTYLGHVGAAFLDGKGEGKGFFSAVKPLMVDFSEYLQSITPHAEELGVKFGQSFTNMIDKIKEAKSWYDNLSDGQQDLIKKVATFGTVGLVALGPVAQLIGNLTTVVGGATRVFGGLVTGVGAVVSGIGKLSTAIKGAGGMLAVLKMGFAAINWPITLTVAAISAVTAGLVALYNKSETFRDIVNTAVEAVKNKFLQFKEVVSTLFGLFTGGLDFTQAREQLNGVVSESTVQRFQSVRNFIEKIKLSFEALGAVISDEAGIGQLKNLFGDTFSDETLGRILIVGETVRNFVDMVKQKFAEFAEALSQAFQGNFEPLLEFIQQLIPKIVMMLIGGLPALIYAGMSLITKLAEGMGVSVPELIEKVAGIITTMLMKFTEALPRIIETGANIILKLINGFTQMLPNLIEAATGIISTILQTISEILPRVIYAGVSILTSLISGIIDALPQIIDTSVKMINVLVNTLIDLLPEIIDAGIKILRALINGILKILPQLINAGVKLITTVASAVIDNLPKIIDAGIEILLALIDGIIKILPQLIEAGLKIIVSLFKALIDNLPKIIEAGVELLFALIDGLIKTIPELVKAIPKIVKAIFDAFKDVDWAGLGKDILDGILEGLKDIGSNVWDSVKDVGNNIKDSFADFFDIHSPSRVMADLAKFLPEGIAKGITDNQEVVAQAMKMLNGMIKNSVQQSATVDVEANANQDDENANTANPLEKIMKGFAEQIPQAQEKVKQFIAQWNQLFTANDEVMLKIGFAWLNRLLQGANEAYPKIVERVKQLINQINTIVKNNYKSMYKQGRTTLQKLLDGFNSLYGNTINRVKQLIAQVNKLIKDNYQPMYNQGRRWLRKLLDGFNSLYSQMIDRIKQLISQINKLIQNNNKPMYNQGRAWLQELRDGFNSLYDSFINLISKLCSEAVKKIRDKHGDFYNAGKYLIEGLKDGISAMKGPIGDIMNDVANKMIGGIANGVSGVRSGVNHILKEVDSDKRIDEWDVPKYAKGTKGGGHPADGPAIVNDQSGPISRRRELIQNPDGSTFMAKAKNSLVNLQKGARVFNADMTNKLRKGGHIPHYKNGTDDTDVFDLVDDKDKFSKFIKDKINLDSVGEPWKDMSKKASKMMIDAAYDMVEDEASFGMFDGKMDKSGKWKVYNYLWDVAQKVMDKFPGMSVTSGYRDGDPNHHGKHQAIDIAYSASANGSSKYLKPANYAFDKFKDQIAYVITQGRVKDRVGSSGHGPSESWMNWGSSDHDDHLHLSGQYGPGDVGKGGGKNGNWTEAINQAAKRMKVKPTKKQISGINSMIQAESGGDEKVSQQIHDMNSVNGSGGAKGLLQFIEDTFSYYAVKGHKNIWSGLDQLMAFFNNSNWKNSIAPNGGWSPSGTPRFEHGGLINRHMVAEMGEGNKPEMVLPLTNKARSLDLMAKAMHIMGVDDKNASSSSSFSLSVVTELLQENNRLTKQNTELLEQVRDKDNDTYLNDRKVSTGLGPSMDRVQGQRRKYKERGLNV